MGSLIASIIKDYPKLLVSDAAEKSIGPKLNFLQSRGASTSELTENVSKVPKILGKRVGKTISMYYDFIKEIIEADKSSNYVKICRSSLQAEGSPQENKFRNLLVLRELGVPQRLFFSLLISKQQQCICGKEKFEESLKKVVEMGFDPKTPKFVNALKAVYVKGKGKGKEEGKGNPDSVLNLFKSYGFTDTQISSIIKDYPGLLRADAEKSIGPKLKFLQSRGASTSELTEIVSTLPKILGKRWDKAISVYYDFVKEIIEADKSSSYVKLCPYSLQAEGSSPQENKFRNVLVLRDLGVPQRLLFSLLISDYQPLCGKEKFEKSLKKVVDMGFDPTTSKFVEALRVIQSLSEKAIENKVNILCKRVGFAVGDIWYIFKKHPMFMALSEKNILNSFETFLSLGFSRDEFLMMVKCFPQCLKLSTESITKKTEFVVKKMKWPLKAVVSFPVVFGFSMEKRIVPRCNVIIAIRSKGSEHPSINPVLSCTNEVFIKRYIEKHHDKEELMTIFTGSRVS